MELKKWHVTWTWNEHFEWEWMPHRDQSQARNRNPGQLDKPTKIWQPRKACGKKNAAEKMATKVPSSTYMFAAHSQPFEDQGTW